MDDNFENIKQQWSRLAARTDALEEANRRLAQQFANTRASSLQDKLAWRISLMGWIALLLPVLAPTIYYVIELPWWVALIYGIFGVAMSVGHFALSEFIRAQRLAELPVADAIVRATRIRRWQSRLTIAGIIVGVSVIALMGFMVPLGPEREAILVGGAVGLAIGLPIGIYRTLANARLSRQLLDSVRN